MYTLAMSSRRRLRRFLIAFATGVLVAVAAALFTHAIGHPGAFVTVDEIISVFGLLFGVAFLTGLNLGTPRVISGNSMPVRPGTGLCCLLFSLGVYLATLWWVAIVD
jgi:hypothetical protein